MPKAMINFETRPSKSMMMDYVRNGTQSELGKELLYIIESLHKYKNVQTITLRSFLLNNEKINRPVSEMCKQFNTKSSICRSSICLDIFPFIATSIVILNFKNIKKISRTIQEYKIHV